jgi:thiosulfate/3-mercaptopyruvate sulfurtransferase
MFTTLISASDLKDHLNDDNLIIVDCRFDLQSPEMGEIWYRKKHIPRAVYANLDSDLSSEPHSDEGRHPLPSAEQLRDRFSRLGIDGSKQVVVYDNLGGVFAGRLWWMLKYMGHEAAAVLDGGWEAWEQAGFSAESGTNANRRTNFIGEPIREMLVVFDEVDDQPLLIDSRDAARYAGEFEPIDARAGHIPGAKNRWFGNNWQPNSRLMADPATLRAEFEALIGDHSAEAVTFYCGSGVSANVNLLAMRHAGLPMPKLYVGSWSEYSKKVQ